ncbi:hypothetical protein SERLA73DRAFT_186112 [Serpula lacrymans var. lacrymans S7.3]|uniref:Uncharacterized protein n=2 Tax=Serpula lacrymans var. lacrymans TaxID=341189 RepID=F8Q6Z8_SERL3|nr:uncharacterized protein SERLADRAFT_474979 [Serpula lacrymans var. lacrymans S7.9]EGN96386.1 hypothetical protein SERLA73DRAFT_186112 [Serpula lacrymans var. lacrymans S7.3]EGO21923.1 hypothetical protein SERLADRAFT_474979 [Serpula lacrymans var. lacrymans S7.9]
MVIRIINIAFFLHNYISALKGVAISLLAAETLRNSWRIKLEWILQCVNNLFVSFMFLRRLQRYAVSGQGDSGIGKHFRGLFLIALSNFVFPVVLNIIQLSLIFISKSSFSQIALIYLVNNFITIFGVVFATLWISGRHMKEQSSRGAVLPIVSSGFVTVHDRRDTGAFFVASSQTRMSSNNTQTSFANDPYDIGKVNSIGTSSSSVPMEITVNVSTECNSV